jgi:amino acid transporter
VRLNGPVRTPDDSPQALALGRLGATAVVLLALGAIAPLAVLITAVPAAYARGGGPLVPLGFVVVALVLLLFAAGYAAMAHRAPFAAAMSTYVARGLGRPCGVGAAWVALPSYAALQLGLYGLSAVAAMPLLRGWLSMTPRWWTVAAALWAVVTVCGTLRVEITARLVGVFVIAEVGVTAGLAAVNFLDPAGGRITAGSIVADHPAGLDRPALGLLLAAGVLAFTGFETTGTYAEESVRPRRAPGRATYAVVVCFALLLAAASWSMSVAAGPDQVADLAGARGPELLFDLAAARLAPWAVTQSRIVLLTGLLAALVAQHHATTP